jgi:hypothetical protein
LTRHLLRKEDLKRSYFRDLHELQDDPSGKLFLASSFVRNAQLERFALLDKPLTWSDGQRGDGVADGSALFSQDALKARRSTVVVCYQMGAYARWYANEWKREIVSRWPQMSDKVFGIEVRDRGMAYALMRAFTQRGVEREWSEGLTGENKRLLVWQEKRSTRLEMHGLKKALGLRNRYIPFVFALQHQGLVTYKAVGKPYPPELRVLGESIEHG